MGLLRLFFATITILSLGLAAFGLIRVGLLYYLYAALLARVTEATGLDFWLARAVTLALVAALWFFPVSLLVLPWIRGAKRQVALWAAFLILPVAAMELVTRDVYFSRADGRPLKYYVATLVGYKLASSPGVDPVYGVPYRPITSEVARDLILWNKRGGRMQDPALPEGRYFDPATGEPLRWYAVAPDGRIDMFALPGFDPKFGTKLAPATSEVVARYEEQEEAARRQRQEEESERKKGEARKAERKSEGEANRRTEEEQRRQATGGAASKEHLKPGRYFFSDPQPSGEIGRFRFTLTEVDLTAEVMSLRIAAAFGPLLGCRMRVAMISSDGTVVPFRATRAQKGRLEVDGDWLSSVLGGSGAFVVEFPPLPEGAGSTFTISFNDRPVIPVDLRNAAFRSF